MNSHSQTIEELQKQLKTTPEGLSSIEAQNRLKEYGENRLKEAGKKSLLVKFLEQFKDVMVLILLAAAAVSFFAALSEHDSSAFFEPLLILLIVVLNAIMGVIQENKAERSLEALMRMAAPHARVIRDGQEQVIDAAALVPGDIIKLEAGDFVPADARLITSSSLKSEESALTGESLPAEKDAETILPVEAPLGDRTNSVYSGCSIVYGTAVAIVTETGMNTQMGKIAGMLEGESEVETPLQQKLAQLGKYMGALALIICAVIFAMGLAGKMPVMEIFMTAVSLAVSAIPEGLPVIVTIVLSIGVERMAKRNAIVKKLPAVETLGSTSVICSDKTGTLTQNKMTLTQAYSDKGKIIEKISPENSPEIRKLLLYGTLCSNGSIRFEEGKEIPIGDPTETSIVSAAYQNGIRQEELASQYPRAAELPFDSDRKLMTTIQKIDGSYTAITKGAFDMLAKRCIQGDIKAAAKVTEEMSSQALRVLAIAYRTLDKIPEELTSEALEQDLTFLGLVGMIDPPREEAKQAVELCKRAGIRPIMITGDHVVTASAIAGQLGILEAGQEAVTGMELQSMSEEAFSQKLEHISVYARVSPEDKIRVVKAWQKKGRIVSMTGDGVNDAPALKAADIGCAMGITGTDVAKGAADMTLQDDNFATIVAAVREGRGIYNNIRKTVGFLLGTNIGEVLLVFCSMLFFKVSPLLSMQLLWINLVTDSLPAIALGMEPVEDSVMDAKPRPREEGIFAHGMGIQVILQGIMFGILSLAAFWIGCTSSGGIKAGRTMAFLVLGCSQIFHAFNMRSAQSLFRTGIFTNRKLNLAAMTSIILMACVLYIPLLSQIFGLTTLPARMYGTGFALALFPIAALELVKALGLIAK
ncbi:MAG: cation-translocating P-type ATPase [Lachnospiraceae bacterium]|jgi:Ca2+-transporting ATPase|nr:cation-translocating P-type ATPase [Lachnospiraceae bacterium]